MQLRHIALSALLALAACAHTDDVVMAEGRAALGIQERLLAGRAAYRQLRAHPRGSELGAELDKADGWLSRAERLSTDEDASRAEVELVTRAAEAQLLWVRAALAAKDEAEGLEQAKIGYDERRRRVTAMRQENAAFERPEDAR